ncbi:MAG: sulfatase [Niabella sp.]
MHIYHNKTSIGIVIFMTGMMASCKQMPAKSNQATQPNILFIAVDDLRPDINAYGNSLMITPHIDELAKEGRLFLNHYVNVPTCGASRYAMLTGRYPQNTDALQNNIFERTTAIQTQSKSTPETFIELFRSNGYHTIGIGKISHAADGRVYAYDQPVSNNRELPNSWDELLFNAGKWGTGWNAFFGYANGDNRVGQHSEVKPYESANINDEGLPDGLTASLAVSQLRSLKNTNKPFFLAVGFFKPHLPFTAPKKYWDLYHENSIPLSPIQNIPENVNVASLHNSPEFNQYKKGEEHPDINHPVSDAYAKKIRHAYFAAISYVDAQIGKVLQALKKTGLDRNTIVVLWGDHGWHLGDQRMWGKHSLSEYALKSALIIKYPGMPAPGIANNSIVQSVDIYPTLLDLTHLKSKSALNGTSLVKQLRNVKVHSVNRAYSYFNKGISLRIPRYRITKYYRNEKPTVELYDYLLDPFETKNIADKNKMLIDSLLPILETGNTGLYQ